MNREGEEVEGTKGDASSTWDKSRLQRIVQSKKSDALPLSPQKDLESEHRVSRATHRTFPLPKCAQIGVITRALEFLFYAFLIAKDL